jgi:NAD(P)H-nitrite reductase large subunit
VPGELLEPSASSAANQPADDDELICSCNAVTRGTIVSAIRAGGLHTVAQVARTTRASTGCGSCAREVEAILGSSDRNTGGTAAKPSAATIAA